MFHTTDRIRLRIDLALTDGDVLAPAAPARRPLLVPAAPAIGTDRSRSSLYAPTSCLQVRSGASDRFDS